MNLNSGKGWGFKVTQPEFMKETNNNNKTLFTSLTKRSETQVQVEKEKTWKESDFHHHIVTQEAL